MILEWMTEEDEISMSSVGDCTIGNQDILGLRRKVLFQGMGQK